MTLEQISYIGQAVAAVAVLFSLAAVYGQLRQTNKIAKAELTHSVWLAAGQMNLSLFDSPEKADLMLRALYGTAPLSDADRLRMVSVISVALGVGEAGFTLKQRGLMEEGTYQSLEWGARLYLQFPIVQQWWVDYRNNGRDPAYIALIDGMVAEIKRNPPARAGDASIQ
jgi:hypothetical protein